MSTADSGSAGRATSVGADAITPGEARSRFRAGVSVPTAPWCRGATQANLVVLPRDWAWDMLLFSQRNPAACPLLEVTDDGATESMLAPGSDLRTDLPRYRVWVDGELVEEPTDVTHLWRDDLVSFLIGCSFTFERGLLDAGVPVRHLEQGRNVPMYRTSRSCVPAGRLEGDLVVSMRPVPPAHVAAAVQATARMPAVHGAPVHVGDPASLGVTDLATPDFGDSVVCEPSDVPVFWACGVTPQVALMTSRPPFAITHAPGHMFITDALDDDYRLP